MKIDAIEIFQTIRATLQPYATEGFSNRINSEEAYDLWSEKNVEVEGHIITEAFFAGIKIVDEQVIFRCYSGKQNKVEERVIAELSDPTVKNFENELLLAYKIFVEREWI